jgi:inorganic pyrophosphatase
MHPWHDLDPGTPDKLLAYIEIGRGMRTKYELDKKTGLLRLDRILHGSIFYPINYGIVPRALSEDDDPLDILVLTPESLLPGTTVFTRIIGLLRMSDQKEIDDKLIAVPLRDPNAQDIHSPLDIPTSQQAELRHFFETYTDLEGKVVTVPGYGDRADALEVLEKCMARYAAKKF